MEEFRARYHGAGLVVPVPPAAGWPGEMTRKESWPNLMIVASVDEAAGLSARRIAISGHRRLPGLTADLVETAIRGTLAEAAPSVTGISCLADGADQIFARAVTDLGGGLEAVIPADQYRDGLPADSHPEYDRLLAKAAAVRRLPFAEPTSESYMAASKLMIDAADELIAVWDGQPARGYGGTADVVAYAREHGKPVHVIWPPGAQRD
jgi:hypothetical protein